MIERLINDQVVEVRGKISDFKRRNSHALDEYLETLDLSHNSDLMIKFQELWKGKWYYPDYNVYSDLSEKSNENYRYEEKTVAMDYYNRSNVNVINISKHISSVLKEIKLLNNDIIAELTVIRDNPKFENQVKILYELEHHKWGVSKRHVINQIRPKGGVLSLDQISVVSGYKSKIFSWL